MVVNEKYLDKAGFKIDLPVMEPKNAEDFGHSSSGKDQVGHRESIQRKKYMGSCRLESVLIINKMEKFPRRAVK